MTSQQTVPALIILFVSWRVYMRARRMIGRQPFQPSRLKARIAVIGIIALLLGAYAGMNPPVLGALAGGLAVAAGLAWFGVHITKFEDTPQGKFYTPHTGLGLAIIALFVGRMLYRFYTIYSMGGIQSDSPPDFRNPLTYFLFGLTAGYYIAYSAGVLIRSHKPAATT